MTDITRKEFELIVRTSLGSSKQQMSSLAKSVNEIETAIDQQTAAAKRGESSIDELKSSLTALQQVQAAFSGKAGLVEDFQRLEAAIRKTEERVTRTGSAYNDYKAKLESTGEVTDKQQARLIKLSAAYDRAQAALTKQQATLASSAQTLQEAGIATDQLAQTSTQLRTAAAQIGVVMDRAQQSIASYATTVRAAREAEKEFAANDAIAKKAEQLKNLNAAKSAGQQWQDFLRQAAEAEKQLAANNALKKTADDAQAAARQYTTLAIASSDLTPRVISLKDTINALINPAAEARTTLAGVESQVTALSEKVTAIKGPVKDLQTTMQDLNATQKALAQQAALIDSYNRQIAAVKAARAEYVQARDQVNQYANAVRQGGEQGAGFVASLNAAQVRARQAAVALRDLLQTANGSRQALQDAGISTTNLAGAQERLVNATKQTVSATNQLTSAVKEYGVASERVRRSGGLFGDDGGRTTLSFTQRLRGEILALGASYAGLQGQIALAKGGLDAFNARASIKNILGAGLETANKDAIDAEYNYVKGQADRIGLVFDKSAESFAKFAIAASKAGRGRQEVRFIFEAFAEAGSVLGLSQEKMESVFIALEQFFSKGQIMTEELKKQLGNALPGAFEVAQKKFEAMNKAAGKPFVNFNDALKEGKVGLGFVVELADEWRNIVAKQLPDATQRLQAEQNRLNSAIFFFKNQVADAGFADNFRIALKEIRGFFESDKGAQLAESLSTKFTAVAKAIVFLLQHLDQVISLSVAFFAVWAVGRMEGMISDMYEFAKAVKAGEGAITNLHKRMLLLQAFIAGFGVGGLLNQFDIVRKAGALMAGYLTSVFGGIQLAFEFSLEGMPKIAQDIFFKVVNKVTEMAKKVVGIFANIARAGGLTDVADALEKAIKSAVTVQVESTGSILDRFKAKAKAKREEIKEIVGQMLDDIDKPATAKQIAKVADPQTGKPPPVPEGKKPLTQAEIDKRNNEIEAIRTALDAIDARIEKADKDQLAPQLNAIDVQFRALHDKIVKLGGSEAQGFLARLTELTFAAKQDVMRKFNDSIEKDADAINRKLDAVEAAAGRKNKDELQARLKAIEQESNATFEQIAKLRQKLVANGRDPESADRQREQLQQATIELKRLEVKKFNNEQLKKQETEINDILAERAARLKIIDDQEEANIITTAQANEKRKATIDEIQPKIIALADAAKLFAASMAGQIDQTQLDAFIAKMDLAVASAGRLNKTFELTSKQVNENLATGLTNVFDEFGKNIAGAVAGTQSLAQAFRGAGRAFLQFAADFLRQIALMIAKALILKALESAFPGIGTFISGGVNAAVKHDGGMVGSVNNRTRNLPAVLFANATRYHGGGFPGLAPGEVPAILKENEEVLTENDPRNALNGGKSKGGDSSRGVRFVLVDDRSRVHEAMSGAEGDEVIVRSLRRNAPTLRAILNGG